MHNCYTFQVEACLFHYTECIFNNYVSLLLSPKLMELWPY